MKISVGSRATRSGNRPHRLCLGRQTLTVAGIHRRSDDEDGSCLFHVRVLDGRYFVLRRHPDDQWELVAVYGASPRPCPRISHPPIAPLALALALALLRRALHALRRAVRLRRDVPHDLPSGGAPA